MLAILGGAAGAAVGYGVIEWFHSKNSIVFATRFAECSAHADGHTRADCVHRIVCVCARCFAAWHLRCRARVLTW